MRQTNFALALLAAAALTACGGSDSNNSAAPAKPVFAAQISFGDSLSDVGTYAVGPIAAAGGGKYTINGNNIAINATLHGKNWTELMAAQLGLAAPCAAVTGLDGAGVYAVPVVDHPTCFGYAEGGARVTNPVGPGNKLTAPDAIGQLTIPVATQVATHLTRTGGTFKASDVVYVLAGGNDAFALLGALGAAATAAGNKAFFTSLTTQLAANATNPSTAAAAIGAAIAAASAAPGATSQSIVGAAVFAAATQPGNSAVGSIAVYGPMVTKATADGAAAGAAYGAANGPALVPMMAQAAADLAALIRTQIVAKGASHVVLLNLPDLASTPYAKAQSASTQQLIAGMVSGFNIALRVGIDGLDDKVLYVDAFAANQDEVLNPAKYGISNAAVPACGQVNSLVCTAAATAALGDVSHFLFADAVHPAPYGQTLIAKLVADSMVARGWL